MTKLSEVLAQWEDELFTEEVQRDFEEYQERKDNKPRFRGNDRVTVKSNAPEQAGRRGRFIEYTPQGYARVYLNERDDVLLNPEYLTPRKG